MAVKTMSMQRKLTLTGHTNHLRKKSSRDNKNNPHAAMQEATPSLDKRKSNDTTSSAATGSSETATTPPLLALPLELLLNVLDNTSSATILALKQTCRTFQQSIPYPSPKKNSAFFSSADRAEFAALLKRQAFFESCHDEESHSGKRLHHPEKNLKPLCSACLTRHWKTAFTSEELSHPPSERKCKGTQRTLKVCQHINFKFADLYGTQVHPSAMHFACPKDLHGGTPADTVSCPEALYFYHGKPLFKEPPRYTQEEWAPSIWLSCTFPVLRNVRGRNTTTVAMVANALKDNDTRVCPHMKVNDAHILRCAYRSSMPSWMGKKKPFTDDKKVPWLQTWTPLWHDSPMEYCHSPGCMTVFGLRLEQVRQGEDLYEVKLCVQRDVGLLLDASDHKWLSQVTCEEVSEA